MIDNMHKILVFIRMLLYVCSIFCYYYPAWLQVATQLDTLAEEAAKNKGGHFAKQK